MAIDLSTLRGPDGATGRKKRIGRGEGSGTGVTAGRGNKGQKSRSGYKRKRGFEGGQMPLHRRLPKRGFHNPFRVEYAVVNLDTLSERFEDGAEVTPEKLRECRLVRESRALVKVLARGELSKRLVVKAHKFSGKARDAIASAGGQVEVLPARPKKDESESAG
jgi:large subunit ribosomal protein L15